jgi:hypothetical protein
MKRIHPVFHVSKLKSYRDSDSFPTRSLDQSSLVRPPPEWFEGEEAWEVEKVVGKRERKVGKKTVTEYLVLWKGYPEWEKTWEPESNLRGARECVEKFERSVVKGERGGGPE